MIHQCIFYTPNEHMHILMTVNHASINLDMQAGVLIEKLLKKWEKAENNIKKNIFLRTKFDQKTHLSK